MLKTDMNLILCTVFVFLTKFCLQTTGKSSEYKSYKNYKIIALQNGKNVQPFLASMKQFDNSLNVAMNETHTEILVAPDLVQVVDRVANENELLTHIVIDDFEKIREECVSAGSFSWTSYYDVAGIHGYLRNMSRMYPKWAKVVSAGKSYEARDMLGLRIKTRTPGVTQKPIIFIESGIHAREWITPATTTYFINQLLTSTDPAIQAMREQFEWHIFPTVNPDGYQYSCDYNRLWRKTRSKSSNGCYGTDPNRNWDYNWMTAGTSNDPCDDQYGGTKPFSEAETTNLKNYLSHFNPAHLKAYIAFHSDAQRLLLPYSDTAKHLDNYDDMVKIGKVSKIYGYKVNKAIYLGPGTAKEILYPVSGGSMDWVKYKLSTPLVLTYELRGTHFEWPSSRIYEQGDEVTQMLLGLLTEARKLGYFDSKLQ